MLAITFGNLKVVNALVEKKVVNLARLFTDDKV